MRLTEFFHFLKENPIDSDSHLFTHIDIFVQKKQIQTDKEFRKSVRRYRKQGKEGVIIKAEVVNLFDGI